MCQSLHVRAERVKNDEDDTKFGGGGVTNQVTIMQILCAYFLLLKPEVT